MKNSILLESGYCYKAKWGLYSTWFMILSFRKNESRILVLCDHCENDGFRPGEIVSLDLNLCSFSILEKY